MKERKLTIVLALLAALALVFAAGCAEDGQDGAAGADATYVANKTYEVTDNTHTISSGVVTGFTSNQDYYTIQKVTLAFGESGGKATVTVNYTKCAYEAYSEQTSYDHADATSSSSYIYTDTTHEASLTADYEMGGNYVWVTLPAGGFNVADNAATTLTFTLQDDGDLLLTGPSGTLEYDVAANLNIFSSTEFAGGSLTVDTTEFSIPTSTSTAP